MPVAEIIISSFIGVIMEKLATAVLTKLAPSEGIDSQLNKCKNVLSLIRSLLVDAGKKQITDKTVQLWLDHLQDLAYDVDDILDDLATEAHRRRKMEESESTSKVRKVTAAFSRFPSTVKYGQEMSSKLEDITRRLDDLLEKKNSLGLNENVEKRIGASRRRRESSLLEPVVIGREGDKEVLLKKLLGSETCNQNVCIVPIVGMGGIGKTTLARLLYNDEKVKHHFELKVWVCVSDEFDVFMISKIIFEAVTGENKDFADLNMLQVALQDKLSKKRFLLVLDDVWNEDGESWEQLQRPFQAGAPGSKIIVTTRSGKVVSTMGRVQDYSLGVLSSDESLSLFAEHALGERNFDAYPALKPHGESLVKKCKGLPLALITLGRALSTTVNEEEWKEFMNSEIWSSQEDRYNILPALKLSYHYLPRHLKLLFAYCSLFPKDYMFDKDEIVLLWMAEGFLHDLDGKGLVEHVGFRYFEELLSRSFFQHAPNEESRYIMHDLMNDLATCVAGQFFCRLDEKKNGDEKDEALEKLCYFSFIRQEYGVYGKFKAFQKTKRLRTFLPMPVHVKSWQRFCLSNKVLVELLPQLKFLRVLSLSKYCIKELPDSIGSLKLLRYLNCSHTEIACLPEEISDLHNLQTLLLRDCKFLTTLPNSFVSLVNLRHLDISDTPKLKNMPLGIGGLTSLQTLSKVIIEETESFKIAELRGLSDLRGQLSIEGLDKVKTASHAKEANLVQKKSLDDLEMEWSDKFDGSRNEKIEFEVLETLRPHDKLQRLEIKCYRGTKFPSWVGDPSFEMLTQVRLSRCRNCAFLPSLGHLRSLQKLFIADMDCVKTIRCELLGTGNSLPVIAFPKLEVLEFSNMGGLEKWSTNSSDNNKVFPCLGELRIHGCPKLVEVSIQPVPSIRCLDIDGCSEEVLRSMVGITSSLTKLSIRNIAGLMQLQGGVIKFLKGVEELHIWNCKDLRYLWESEAEACKILVNLRTLRIQGCKELVSLREKEEEVNKGNNLTSLRQLVLDECPRLECFSIKRIEECEREGVIIFPNLEILTISWCSGMKWLPTGQKKLPSTLKRLWVSDCENVLLEESGGNSSSPLLYSMSSLEYIYIWKWPNVKWLLSELRLFIHLITLSIYDCEGIECFPEQGGSLPQSLTHLSISNCKNLKWFAVDDELQSLTCLVDMRIVDCPSLYSAFPRGVWPPNLTNLDIGGLKKPMTEWGPQNFPTSLVSLTLLNESCLVSFPEVEEECVTGNSSSSNNPTTITTLLLPSSLTRLYFKNCERLESLSKGLQHLTSLEKLQISNCPKLRDLPDTLLPQLSVLYIYNSPKLEERCSSSSSSSNRRDSYWPTISHIPCLDTWY